MNEEDKTMTLVAIYDLTKPVSVDTVKDIGMLTQIFVLDVDNYELVTINTSTQTVKVYHQMYRFTNSKPVTLVFKSLSYAREFYNTLSSHLDSEGITGSVRFNNIVTLNRNFENEYHDESACDFDEA